MATCTDYTEYPPAPGDGLVTVRFSGYSDDTFGFSTSDRRVEDHDDCAKETVRTVLIQHATGALAVTGVYGHSCLWSVGIAPIDDDDPLPEWPMTWRFEGYTTVLELVVPADALIEFAAPRD